MDVGLIFIRISLIRKLRPGKSKQLFGAKNAWPKRIRTQVSLTPGEEKWGGFLGAAVSQCRVSQCVCFMFPPVTVP